MEWGTYVMQMPRFFVRLYDIFLNEDLDDR